MKTYDAILALSEKPSIREMFGEFLCISKNKDFFLVMTLMKQNLKNKHYHNGAINLLLKEIMKFLFCVSLNVMKKMGL